MDIGVTTLPVDHHLFESISLNKEDLRVVLHREHPLAYKTKIKMEELAEENFILFNEDFYLNDKIIENAKTLGSFLIWLQISQWNVIENLIINKLGITILPATISELLNDDVKMIQLENANTEWELGVVWKKISV